MTRLRFTIFLVAFLSIFLFANKVNADVCGQPGDVIQLSVHIPGLSQPGTGKNANCYYMKGGLPEYIAGIYNFGLMVAGFLAMVMIMIGGFMYIAAGGNQTIIGKAKERIVNAIVGLILLLLAYTILNTINPDLVNQKKSIDTLKGSLPPAPENPATPTNTSTGGTTKTK